LSPHQLHVKKILVGEPGWGKEGVLGCMEGYVQAEAARGARFQRHRIVQLILVGQTGVEDVAKPRVTECEGVEVSVFP
jgi:hypothetical protein